MYPCFLLRQHRGRDPAYIFLPLVYGRPVLLVAIIGIMLLFVTVGTRVRAASARELRQSETWSFELEIAGIARIATIAGIEIQGTEIMAILAIPGGYGNPLLREPLVDLRDRQFDLLLTNGVLGRFRLTLQGWTWPSEATRALRTFSGSIFGPPPPRRRPLGLTLFDLLLDARFRVDQAFSGITHKSCWTLSPGLTRPSRTATGTDRLCPHQRRGSTQTTEITGAPTALPPFQPAAAETSAILTGNGANILIVPSGFGV